MLIFDRNNREEIENEYLALLSNKPELFDITIIEDKYLGNENNKKLFAQLKKYYKKHKNINPTGLLDEYLNEFNVEHFVEIFTDTFYYDKNYENQLKDSERLIVKLYKEDEMEKARQDMLNLKITSDEYSQIILELNKLSLETITKEKVLDIGDVIPQKEQLENVKSGIEKLDNDIKGFTLGQLSVWSGGNASAKSTFLNQLAIESINQGYNTLIYSGELIPERLKKWLTMQACGKQNMKYYREKDYYFVDDDTKNIISDWFKGKLFAYNNQCGNKVVQIIATIREEIKKKNIKVVIIDNLMSMNLSEYGKDKYDVQSIFVQELSDLAKEFNVHIHFVCHPRKTTTFLRKVDISGSADLTNIADNVFIMHRVNTDFKTKTKELFGKAVESLYDYTNVIEVCKNRNDGVEDDFIGMYFEKESKRLLNTPNEKKVYGCFRNDILE